jgi:hypothetical protein
LCIDVFREESKRMYMKIWPSFHWSMWRRQPPSPFLPLSLRQIWMQALATSSWSHCFTAFPLLDIEHRSADNALNLLNHVPYMLPIWQWKYTD